MQYNLSITAPSVLVHTCLPTLTQEAAVSTAGFDLTDTSALTQDQWGMVCPQFKPVLAQQSVADLKKHCSPKLGDLFEAVKTKCSPADKVSGDSGMSEEQSKTMMATMCQGISTMVGFDFPVQTMSQNVVNTRELDQL